MSISPSPPRVESTTPLGDDDTFTGVTCETNGYEYFRTLAASDQDGTLNVQYSHDGETWFTSFSEPIAAGEATVIESTICSIYVRAQVVNGATPQTTLLFTSCMRNN